MFSAFDRLLDWITTLVKIVMLVMTSVIFVIICVTVFTRYILNFVPSWSEEVPRYLLVWITYLGAALAVRYKEHISLDIFFNLLPARLRQFGHLFLNLLIAAVGAIMLIFGLGLLRDFGADLMESIPVTNFWLYLSMPISGGLIILYIIRQEWEDIRGLREGREEAPGALIPY
jgi:TRAP-type C4-dicarboxylate transport system permease small subunit